MLDSNLKQRLVGAAVLIGLAVVVIPLLLRGAGEPSHEEAQARKRLISADRAAATAPLQESAAGGRAPELGQAALPSLAKQNPSPSSAQGSISAAPAKEVNARSAKIPEQPEERGWFVQIGSFTQQDNAQRARDKAGSLGYRAFITTAIEGTKTIYRVQVGPEAEADRAKKLKQELEHRLQVKAFLISPSEG